MLYSRISALNNVGKHRKQIEDRKMLSNVPMPPSLNLSYPVTSTFLSLKLLYIAPPTKPNPIIDIIMYL